MTERCSVNVLRECIDLQNKKSNDYQNPNSSIKQADYYPNGCMTLLDTIQAKVLRMRSVMEAMVNDPNYRANFESLEDSAKDLINYASFFVAYSRGGIDGQKPDRDFLNRKIETTKGVNVNHVLRDVDFGEWEYTTVQSPGVSVKANLVDVSIDPKAWSIGARGSDR